MLKDHRDIVKSLDFAPDGSLNLLSASRDGTVKFWDLNDDGNMYKSVRANTKWVYDAKWSPKCDKVASVGSDKSVSTCQEKYGKPVWTQILYSQTCL